MKTFLNVSVISLRRDVPHPVIAGFIGVENIAVMTVSSDAAVLG